MLNVNIISPIWEKVHKLYDKAAESAPKPLRYNTTACINELYESKYDVCAGTRCTCSPLPAWSDVFFVFLALSLKVSALYGVCIKHSISHEMLKIIRQIAKRHSYDDETNLAKTPRFRSLGQSCQTRTTLCFNRQQPAWPVNFVCDFRHFVTKFVTKFFRAHSVS